MIYHLYRRLKKNGVFWMDLRVNDCRYREPLGTRDKNEAGELMLKRVEQLKTKARTLPNAPSPLALWMLRRPLPRTVKSALRKSHPACVTTGKNRPGHSLNTSET